MDQIRIVGLNLLLGRLGSAPKLSLFYLDKYKDIMFSFQDLYNYLNTDTGSGINWTHSNVPPLTSFFG